MNDLSALEKPTRVVVFRGQSLTVQALKVGQIPAFTRAVRPLFAALADFITSIPLNVVAGEGGEPLMPDLPLERIADFVAEHGERLIEVVAIAIRRDQAELADADLEEFIALARAVLEVNQDFFGRAMRAAVDKAVDQAMDQPTSGAGPTPSST